MSESANRNWVRACWGVSILALATAACGTSVTGGEGGPDGSGASGPGPGPGPGPAPETGVDPGRVQIHRLNNKEYNNTVRDLLGTTSQPANEFLAEEGLHFDNTASALGMTGLQYEKYFRAAEALLAEPAAAGKYLACTPTAAADPCARQNIQAFGMKIYRRPLEAAEVDRAMKVYDAEFGVGRSMNGAQAMALTFRAMLSAANFLYRIEYDQNPASLTAHSLSAYELASRLSYFQWGTMPDQALFDLAQSGAIFDEATLEAQVDRMLADGKAADFIESFAGQWLDVREIPTHSIVPSVFPTYSNELADAMLVETYMWFQDFLNNDKPLSDWFTADVNFVNDVLAQHYGMPAPGTGSQFAKVSHTTDQRRGFLGLASFLTHTSFPSRTSPTLRGVWVLTELLCDPPPPPPPDVPELAESATPDEMGQMEGAENVKERLERHRTDAACAGCHRILDPMGLGLERFDGIGRYREAYGNGDAIDPAGTLPDGTAFSGPDQLATILSTDPRFNACVASKMYTYALGREIEALDAPILDKLKADWASRGPTLRNLMKEVVTANSFRFRRGEAL